MRKTTWFLIGLLLLAPFVLAAQQAVPNELLVQFKAGATAAEKGRALGRAGAVVAQQLIQANTRRDGKGDLVLVRHPAGPPAQAQNDIASDNAVEFAEPNWIYEHYATATDPAFTAGNLWGMYGPGGTPPTVNQFGSNAVAAWNRSQMGSSAVYVGVIDEGINARHPDLACGNAGTSYDTDYVNGLPVYDGGTSDSHGTHVAGTIGACANDIGVVGTNWFITMISAKFLGPNGGTTSNAVLAVKHLTDVKNSGVNIVATNNSWGGGGFSTALYDQIKLAGDAGILFVAAAGNSGWNLDRKPSFPASYSVEYVTRLKTYPGLWNVIAVGALDSTGKAARWSNYGAKTVLLFAPGVNILSTVNPEGYAYYSGTSMATPHVTGAAALYAAAHPGANAAQIKQAILSGTVFTDSVKDKCITGGRLDVAAAIALAPK